LHVVTEEAEEAEVGEGKRKSNTMRWLLGCSAGVVVLGLSCAGLLFFGYRFAKSKVIAALHEHVSELIVDSGLPQEQCDSMLADLERLRTAAEEGHIDLDQLQGLDTKVARVFALGTIQWYETNAVGSVGFAPEEEAAARRSLQRLARGVQEDLIDPEEMDFRIHVDQDVAEHGWDPDDVRRVVAGAKAEADRAAVPDEPFQADVAAEFAALVDRLIAD
jgi:hypothetical protein